MNEMPVNLVIVWKGDILLNDMPVNLVIVWKGDSF